MPVRHTLLAIAIIALGGSPAGARTATPSVTPTRPAPTATASPTGTPPGPLALILVEPPVARSGQRVVLDGRYSRLAAFHHWTQIDGDVAVDLEAADQAVASFLVPPLGAPGTVRVRLDIAGGVAAAETISLLPARTIEAVVGSGDGPPGGTAPMEMVLRPWGLAVTAIAHEIGFDAHTHAAARPDGTPDCAPGPAVDAEQATFTHLPAGCTPGVSCTGLRAEVVGRQPLPAMEAAYTCRIAIAETARASCYHVVRCVGGTAQSAGGLPLTIACAGDGAISADYTRDAPQFTFRAEPPAPMVGETVELIFTTAGNGGLPGYTLLGTEPVLRLTGPTPAPGGGPLAREIRYTAVADAPGTAPLQLSVYYEGLGGCPGATFFNFRTRVSPLFPLTVRAPETAVLNGRVGRHPQTCGGAREGVTVVLEPLGWRTAARFGDGGFSFGGVPPGDYRVRLESPCGLGTCWAAEAVTLAADEVADVALCPAAGIACPGDCDFDGRVDIAELVRLVEISLGAADTATCGAADSDGNAAVAIDDLVRAINAALGGCQP